MSSRDEAVLSVLWKQSVVYFPCVVGHGLTGQARSKASDIELAQSVRFFSTVYSSCATFRGWRGIYLLLLRGAYHFFLTI